jgi:hypothetical protein
LLVLYPFGGDLRRSTHLSPAGEWYENGLTTAGQINLDAQVFMFSDLPMKRC